MAIENLRERWFTLNKNKACLCAHLEKPAYLSANFFYG